MIRRLRYLPADSRGWLRRSHIRIGRDVYEALHLGGKWCWLRYNWRLV